jgi:hypothetical protein
MQAGNISGPAFVKPQKGWSDMGGGTGLKKQGVLFLGISDWNLETWAESICFHRFSNVVRGKNHVASAKSITGFDAAMLFFGAGKVVSGPGSITFRPERIGCGRGEIVSTQSVSGAMGLMTGINQCDSKVWFQMDEARLLKSRSVVQQWWA